MDHLDFMVVAIAMKGLGTKCTTFNFEHYLTPKGGVQKKSSHKGQATLSAGQKKKDKKDKPKGKCFHCRKLGHWKDCHMKGESKALDKLGSCVMQTLMSTCSQVSWVLDSKSLTML